MLVKIHTEMTVRLSIDIACKQLMLAISPLVTDSQVQPEALDCIKAEHM